MSAESEYFLDAPGDVFEYQCVEISHPSFSKVYRIVRNGDVGTTIFKHEDGNYYLYTYYPMSALDSGMRGNLDQSFAINLGDLGELVPNEIDLVADADTFQDKPTVIYRTYRSDNTESVLTGPLKLQAGLLNFTDDGVSFEAKAPQLSIGKTGELFKLERFPGLGGFLS